MGGSADSLITGWIVTALYIIAAVMVLYLSLRFSGRLAELQPKRTLAFRCQHCGYNLRGIDSEQCPECGAIREHQGVALDLLATKLVESRRNYYEGELGYRPALGSDFAWLDRGFYQEIADELSAHGFRFLGDLYCGHSATVQRMMVSADGSTSVAILEIHPRKASASSSKLSQFRRRIHVQTEFVDGRFLETTNSGDFRSESLPAELLHEGLPSDATVEDLVSRHEKRKQVILQTTSTEPVLVRSADDITAAQERERELERRFRRQIGYADPEEFRSWAIMEGKTDEYADGLAKAIDKARQRHIPSPTGNVTADYADSDNSSAPSA